ncbi:MAG: IS5 family transposase [Paracoccaceae bacterium]|nr:IS5 family transposase [Paracoccaceae bacterium]
MGFVRRERRCGLDEMAAAIDWAPLAARLDAISPPGRGEPGWPPLALFRALLLGQWYDLSDVQLAEALDDRASFRRFCGFAASEDVPERTAFVRFRGALVRRRLEGALFAEVVRQLDARGLTVRTGTLVDATMVRAASDRDRQAGWKCYGKDAPAKGYKAHVATDESGSIVRRVVVTPANRHDSQGFAPLIERRPGRVWADSAYDNGAVRAQVRGRGEDRIMRRVDKRSGPRLNAAKRAWNASIHPVRCSIEKVFGTVKRSYGLARARYLGRRRVSLQVHLALLAYNLRRAATLLRQAPA